MIKKITRHKKLLGREMRRKKTKRGFSVLAQNTSFNHMGVLAVVQLKSAAWGCLWRKVLSLHSAGGRCNLNHLFHGCSSSIRWMKWAMKLKGQSSK